MGDTFQALGVALLAVIPGAVLTLAYERVIGSWGVGLADRAVRFLAWSAILHAFLAPLTYQAYRVLVVTGRIERGEPLPVAVWLIPIAYIGVPAFLGWLMGMAVLRYPGFLAGLKSRHPAPRAWDYLFGSPDLAGWVLVHLKDGGKILGAYAASHRFGLRSYAAGYPDEQDLLLVDTVARDPVSGDFLADEHGNPRLRGIAVLVRWEEARYLEFSPSTRNT